MRIAKPAGVDIFAIGFLRFGENRRRQQDMSEVYPREPVLVLNC
jgi:hypothetical protein